MKIKFYDLGKVNNEKISFVVLVSKFRGKWIYVKHKERETWEMPGGKREKGEKLEETAKRELYEESGAVKFELFEISDYAMIKIKERLYGRLYYVKVKELDKLPQSEIEEVRFFKETPNNLTYKEIHEELVHKVIQFLKK